MTIATKAQRTDIRWIATDEFAVSVDGKHIGYAISREDAESLARRAHTPLPWHRTHNTLNVFAENYKAAIAATFSYEYRESGPSKEEAEANAAFIFTACNACNAYDAHVARIAELTSALREIADMTDTRMVAGVAYSVARVALTNDARKGQS